jgi:phenylacetate-CoA ligase
VAKYAGNKLTMPDHVLFDPQYEAVSTSDLRAQQQAAWSRQWAYVRDNSQFYRGKFCNALRSDVSLDDLQHLPLTTKDELRISQQQHPALGNYLACDETQVVRLHQTSGTTGVALRLGATERDTKTIARVGARAFFAAGLRPTDRVIHCLNYCMWSGGLTDHLSLEAVGAMVVPFGVGNTERLLETIEHLQITAISCTPSYPAVLEKVWRESTGRDPRELGLKFGLFGGEACLDNPAFRQSLKQTWGMKVRNANYGLSEVLSLFAGQCEATNDLHFHAGDVVFAELIDPKTEQRIAIEPEATGEVVCTNLDRQCQPLVRYRTGDLITITAIDRCDCGRTSWRFRVCGRSDDMFNVRGVNVFPTAIQRVLLDHPHLTSGHFRVRLRGAGPYDRIELTVEASENGSHEDVGHAKRDLEAAVHSTIGASAVVTIVPFESMPRTAGKTAWIERTPH